MLCLHPQAGDPDFVKHALTFGYGADSQPLQNNCIQGVQALSGTGGLRVFGEVLRKHGHKHIYVPNPTWGNHIPIMQNSGLEVRKYRYYDAVNGGLDFDGWVADMKDMPAGSCVLLHACAHNPTGMDPTLDQWKQLSELMKERQLLPFFDSAYQGFASGDAEKDAAAVRMFVDDGHQIAMVQSFSKNFGLYGHRVGVLSCVGDSPETSAKVVSQMKLVIRPMYSNPPRHGARIVSTILSDPDMTKAFHEQCKGMADRINSMRTVLRTKLEENGSTKDWSHITKQIGMFAYSGMTKEEVTALRDTHHVYCTMDGRISMAGVSQGNVDYIANAIHDVTK
jgi:aspartate aminotransferase, mitochondrial